MTGLRAPRRRPRDGGFTLAEMLVSMALMTVVMVLTTTILAAVQAQTKDTLARDEAIAQARLAIARMDRQIRSGNVLLSPALEDLPNVSGSGDCQPSGAWAGTCMRVYTQSNGDQRCVQWQVVGGRLRTRSWSPAWQTDHNVSGWAIAARGLQPTAAPFRLQETGPAGNYGARILTITLATRDVNQRAGSKAVDVTTSISGRNTIYGYDQGICAPVPDA